ncbi:hypothetical protein LCGC14_2881900 [marine sediment metagenome]|uniref:Methylmalonyl-CoA mutase domain-containing protein n=1 Tax=marine sediment metagenome TaxID=412755 RepID=A0A0F8Y034_9ZZZZ
MTRNWQDTLEARRAEMERTTKGVTWVDTGRQQTQWDGATHFCALSVSTSPTYRHDLPCYPVVEEDQRYRYDEVTLTTGAAYARMARARADG